MSRYFALTREALAAHAHYFRSFERLLELELSGATVESRYELNFSRLVKPDPFRLFGINSDQGLPYMLGTDQRDFLVPPLAKLTDVLPPGARVLDLGSGDGQTTAAALYGRAAPMTLVPMDPARGALVRYRDHFASELPHISVPETLEFGIDELVGGETDGSPSLDDPFEMVIGVHALYFASDLADLLRFVHERLTPGGRFVIVFAERNGLFSGRLAQDYYRQHPEQSGAAHGTGGDAIDRFFGVLDSAAAAADCETALQSRLGGDLFRVVEMTRQPTRLFGHDLGDIIAAGFLTSLSPADDDQLRQQIGFVSDRLQATPEAFDLCLSMDGPRARMFSVAQPQIFIDLQKK